MFRNKELFVDINIHQIGRFIHYKHTDGKYRIWERGITNETEDCR